MQSTKVARASRAVKRLMGSRQVVRQNAFHPDSGRGGATGSFVVAGSFGITTAPRITSIHVPQRVIQRQSNKDGATIANDPLVVPLVPFQHFLRFAKKILLDTSINKN
jgi:hypothetical protein